MQNTIMTAVALATASMLITGCDPDCLLTGQCGYPEGEGPGDTGGFPEVEMDPCAEMAAAYGLAQWESYSFASPGADGITNVAESPQNGAPLPWVDAGDAQGYDIASEPSGSIRYLQGNATVVNLATSQEEVDWDGGEQFAVWMVAPAGLSPTFRVISSPTWTLPGGVTLDDQPRLLGGGNAMKQYGTIFGDVVYGGQLAYYANRIGYIELVTGGVTTPAMRLGSSEGSHVHVWPNRVLNNGLNEPKDVVSAVPIGGICRFYSPASGADTGTGG